MIKKILPLITCGFLSLSALAQSDYRLMLSGKPEFPAENTTEFIQSDIPSQEEICQGYYYRYIQFYSVPTEQQKELLEQTGIKLLDYIPRNTFWSAIPLNYNKTQLQQFGIRSITSRTSEQNSQ